jgi:signal transduction histidine kinase
MTRTRILIVEDEPVIALDIEESLIALGYDVVGIADSAASALPTVAQTQPDLVLMDVQLRSEPNGIEIARYLRQQHQLPIVFLTAHADAATLAEVKTVQPFGYIVKPFELRDLSVAIEIALSRYQSEISMKQSLEKAKELHEMKSRFISIVSHEFRNPLSSILFSLDLLQYPQQQLTPDKQQVYLSRARTAVERMIQILEDVLIMGEIDANQFDYQPAPLLLIDFCQELVEQLQFHPETSRAILFTATGFDAPDQLFWLDEKLLRYILINLLSNAIKYSAADSEIKFNLIDGEDFLQFQIQDQGIGIAPADQPHLFDSFYRGANVGGIPGTGLGLSIVKQCIEAHQGTITVESQLGVGTTFTVTLAKQFVQGKGDENNPGD